LLLVASILIAAIGTALIGLYVAGADQRAADAAEARYGPPPPEPTATPTPTGEHQDIEHQALSVEVRDEDRVWAILKPDDLVSIWTVTGDPKQEEPKAVRLVDSIRVIAAGQHRSVDGVADLTIPGRIIVVDADRRQTAILLQGQAAGDLYLTVLGKDPAS
jgi:hypothetical protein